MICSYCYTVGPTCVAPNRRIDFYGDPNTQAVTAIAHNPNTHTITEDKISWERQTVEERIEIMHRERASNGCSERASNGCSEPIEYEEPVCFTALSLDEKKKILERLQPVGTMGICIRYDDLDQVSRIVFY